MVIKKTTKWLFGELKDYIIGKITDYIDEKIIELRDKREFKKFCESLEDWISNFILKNETSILESSEFYNYLKNYKLIEYILRYITNTNFSQYPESEFILLKIIEIEEHLTASGKIVTSSDKSVIIEFAEGLLGLLKAYFDSKIPQNQKALKYGIDQLNKKIDRMGLKKLESMSARLNYPAISNIIDRFAIPFKYIQGANVYLHMDESADLYKICQKEHHVVLLGDAGSGKTTILRQVAHNACADYHTLLIQLSDYSGEEIDYLICKDYPDYAEISMFLIFDAFDEINEKNRDDFARKLNSFIAHHPSIIVLISVRNNFYKFSNDEGNGSTFNNFKEYGLFPLTENDIRNFLECNEIDYNTFNAELKHNSLSELSYNPFYLISLAKLMKENSYLPAKKELMNEMVKVSFQFDKDKYINPDIVAESEYRLTQLLKKIAFAMQCMDDKVHICTEDYQAILTELDDRNLIKYSSLFYKNNNEQWQFEHNNFREYLAAEYLNDLGLEKIKEVLCYDKEKNKIRESWVNVISYLVLIYKDNDLFEWIRKTSDSLLVKFEASRVDEETRSDVFIKICNFYAERNMWINHNSNSIDELVAFGQSTVTLDFLLREIQNPRHYWALSNALYLLNCFEKLYYMDDNVRTVIYNCILSGETREYEKEIAVCLLANFNLQTAEITESLINMLEIEKSEYVHNGIVYYLIHCGFQEDFIDVLINELEYSKKYNRGYAGNIVWKIKNAILQIQGRNAIQKLLEYYSAENYHSSNEKDIFQHLIARLIYFYQEGDSTSFDVVFQALSLSHKHYHTVLADNCKQFFMETGTVLKAFDKAVELYIQQSENNDIKLNLLFFICDDKCIELLIKKYNENPEIYEELLLSFTVNFESGNNYLSYCTKLLKENGVEVPSPKKYIDHNVIRQKKNQDYFDALFNKEQYQKLVEKLVQVVGNRDATCDTILNKFLSLHMHKTSEDKVLWHIACDIKHFNLGNHHVSKFTSLIQDWDEFVISNIYKCLTRNSSMIVVSEQQKEYIYEYCKKVVATIDFSNITNYNSNNINSQRVMHFCFFADYFKFKYSRELVKKLTVVPKCLFEKNYSNKGIFSNYVTTHLTDSELCACVQYNIQNYSLCLQSEIEHINFCKTHNLSYALELAEQVCLDSTIDTYYKKIALEYIVTIKDDVNNNYNYICSTFLSTEDEKLLNAIFHIVYPFRNAMLISRLEEINLQSENKDRYLAWLIEFQSKLGLECYYEISKEKMKIPDYDNHRIAGITESISKIDSLSLLSLLIKLQDLLFTEGFLDHSSFGLYSSLSKAYINISRKYDENILQTLKSCLLKENITAREVSFCNHLIKDIESDCQMKYDIPWKISRIKRFMKDNE